MSESAPAPVYVPVVKMADAGREIGWGSNVSELLTARIDDIRDAIRAGAASVSTGLTELPVVKDWHVTKVEASFGITLTAEAGVILSKASTEATFDVTMTFSRTDANGPE
jgi:hypothetical protein